MSGVLVDCFSTCQRHLCEVVDRLGVASAKSQGLPAAITTSNKLTFTDQRVYLYTDLEGNSEHGSAVGFIKVGTKKLFLYDHQGTQRETSPLCILDFYVHESKQRTGYGKKLYEHMLECEGVSPCHLAIDKPSDKFLAFLAKHYKLRATIPQVNNYVVFEGFFSNRKDQVKKRSSRFNKTQSEELAGNPMSADKTRSSTQTRSMAERVKSHQLVHTNSSSSISSAEELAALSDIPLARPSSREKLVHSRHSPVTQNMQAGTLQGGGHPSLSAADMLNQTVDNLPEAVTQLAVSNGGRSQSAQNKAYSRHSTASAALPHQYATSNQSDYQEPLRTRYRQPNVVSTTDRFNTHQHVLNKQGHLKVTPVKKLSQNMHTNHSGVSVQQDAGDWSRNFHSAGHSKQQNSSWNVFGVPPGYSHIANRRTS